VELDRRSLALQVRDHLRERIVSGEFAPDDRLHSEPELAREYGVSRTSVREALKLLEQEGVVVVRHGHGRFVSHTVGLPSTASVTLYRSITEFLTTRGYSVSTRVMSVVARHPTAEEATALELSGSDMVIYLERFRLGDGVPLVYSKCTFAATLLDASVEETDWSGSLVALLETWGVRVASVVVDIQAVNLPGGVAKAQGIPADTAWLLHTETSYDEGVRPVMFSMDYLRGDIRTYHLVQRRER
jgi:GntR family transcriptional regulator